MQIGELAQGPEVLPQITDGALHFAFLPATGRIAGTRDRSCIHARSPESAEETNQAAVMFGDGGGQIVIDDFARHAAARQ